VYVNAVAYPIHSIKRVSQPYSIPINEKRRTHARSISGRILPVVGDKKEREEGEVR